MRKSTIPCPIKDCGIYIMASSSYCAKYRRRRNPEQDSVFDHRPAIIEGDIAKIPLGLNAKDGYAIVDKEFAWLDKYKWHTMSTGYASSHIGRRPVLMHRYILKCRPSQEVDHINKNILDNTLNNIRVVTSKENKINRGFNKNNTSGYRGVKLHKLSGTWHASIMVNYKAISLGYYKEKIDAAKAYNSAVLVYFDKYAYLNKI